MPSDTIVLNNSNMTTKIAPTISENTTITPAPDVNDTLIGGSTPITSNTLETNEVNNKSGQAEPVGRNKLNMTIYDSTDMDEDGNPD